MLHSTTHALYTHCTHCTRTQVSMLHNGSIVSMARLPNGSQACVNGSNGSNGARAGRARAGRARAGPLRRRRRRRSRRRRRLVPPSSPALPATSVAGALGYTRLRLKSYWFAMGCRLLCGGSSRRARPQLVATVRDWPLHVRVGPTRRHQITVGTRYVPTVIRSWPGHVRLGPTRRHKLQQVSGTYRTRPAGTCTRYVLYGLPAPYRAA